MRNALLIVFLLLGLHLSAAVVEVPLEYQSGHLLIDVQLAGENKPRRFMFDTGASVCVFWGTELPEGLRFDEELTITDIHGQKRSMPMTEQFACSINGFALTPGVGMREDNASSQMACIFSEVDGVLGMSVLRDRVFRVDYGAGKLWVADDVDELSEIEGEVRLKNYVQFNPDKPQPRLMMGKGLNGAQLQTALIDTGSDSYFDLDSLTIASMEAHIRKAYRQKGGSMTVGLHGSGLNNEIEYCFQNWHPFGKNAPAVKRGTASWHNLVGAKVLQNYILTFDLANARAWVAPCAPCMAPKLTTGLALDISQAGNFTVGGIFEDTAAEAAEIQLNWQVLSINGVVLGDLTDFCTRISSLRREMYAEPPYKMEFLDADGQQHNVTLVPKLLCE